MYKKHGRHDIDAKSANNEEQFVTQFINFMGKHPDIVISQVSIPQINLDIGTAMPRAVPALSSVGSTPDHQKYHVDGTNKPTPCTLLYVKGGTLRTIKVADAIVMATHIIHGRPFPSKCAVVEMTKIREGCDFEDLDYPDEEEQTEKMKDAKGNFILWPRKDLILKTHSSPIVLPQSIEDEGTPTFQNTTHSTVGFTPPSQNPLQTTPPPENPPSTQPLEHHSPQYRSPPYVHSPKSPPHTTPPPQNPPNAPKKQDAIVDEPNKDPNTVVEKFYDCLKNYKTKKPLEDLAIEGMTVEEFWQHGDKDYREFEYEKPLVLKYVHLKFQLIMQKFHKWYFLACVYGLNFVEATIPRDIFNTLDFDLNIELAELHAIFSLQMLNITMMIV
jgi:hypothetical protein